MRQQSLTGGFDKYRKKTRKEPFLEEMDKESANPGHRIVLCRSFPRSRVEMHIVT